MPQTKTIRSKTIKKAPAVRPQPPADEAVEGAEFALLATKVKKDVIIDEDEVLPPVAEKLEELSPFGESAGEEDSGEEEVGLDDEELNPFGDKWEV